MRPAPTTPQLRALIDSCEALADDLDRGLGEPAEALAEVARLREAFDAHNRVAPLPPESPCSFARAHGVIERRAPHLNPVAAELHATLAALREHLADSF